MYSEGGDSVNILGQSRLMLLTDNYLIRVCEFAYGKRRWAVTATSMRSDIPPVKLGEYDTEYEARAAFDRLVKNIDKIEV